MEVSEKDVKDASGAVLKDLKRFQSDKEEDLRKYMVSIVLDPLNITRRLIVRILARLRTLSYSMGTT